MPPNRDEKKPIRTITSNTRMYAVERDVRAQTIFSKMAPCMPLRYFLEEETPLILLSNTYIFSFKQGTRSNSISDNEGDQETQETTETAPKEERLC